MELILGASISEKQLKDLGPVVEHRLRSACEIDCLSTKQIDVDCIVFQCDQIKE